MSAAQPLTFAAIAAGCALSFVGTSLIFALLVFVLPRLPGRGLIGRTFAVPAHRRNGLGITRDQEYTIEGHELVARHYRRPVKEKPFQRLDLTAVNHIDSYVSPWSQEATVRLTFWAERPLLVIKPFIGASSVDRSIRDLGFARAPDLYGTEAHLELLRRFLPRIADGTMTTNIDLLTLTPISGTEPGLDPFTTVRREGKNVIVEPREI